MSSRHLDQYKGNFYIMNEVLIANLPPAKAPITRMRFQIVPFSYRCVFKSIHFGLRIQMFSFSVIILIISVWTGGQNATISLRA